MTFGVSSMTAPLARVAVRKPGPALLNADPKKWHYGPLFDPGKIEDAHSQFCAVLRDHGAEVVSMEGDDADIADSVFTYDASLMTPKGAILMSPGKPLRRGEEELHRAFYESQNIPIIGQISGNAHAEAGDTLWLDDEAIIIGRGFRTNAAGADQLTAIFSSMNVASPVFDLPVYLGRDACLHLMSLISMVDTKKALVCTQLLPVGLWEFLIEKEIELIDAPFDEFESTGTLSTNVLATSPGKCIMLDGIPKTRSALENAGLEVSVFSGDALCIACEGGPTCLTRPLLRQS